MPKRYHSTNEAKLRAKKARALVVLPTQCWRCGGIIAIGQPFDMGHLIDVARGGADSPLMPEHRGENRRKGGQVGSAIANRHKSRGAKPSW